MEILKRSTVNQNKGRSGQIPVMIVCHRTCGSFDGAVSWLCNPESQASAHFIVAKNGRVVQLVDIEDTAWCNGTSMDIGSSKYFKNSTLEYVRGNGNNANSYTVSIEFEGLSNESGELTEKQFDVGVELVKFIVSEVKRIYGYQIQVDSKTLVGHCHITPKWKPNCPGVKFPFDRLINELEKCEVVLKKRSFIINGKKQDLECFVEKGITYLPIRKVAEGLNAIVQYDSKSSITRITSK